VHFDNVEKNSVYAEDENNYTRLNCKIPGPFICIRITGYSTIAPYATVKDDWRFPQFSQCACVNGIYFVPIRNSTYSMENKMTSKWI